jgi:hypothetical protein
VRKVSTVDRADMRGECSGKERIVVRGPGVLFVQELLLLCTIFVIPEASVLSVSKVIWVKSARIEWRSFADYCMLIHNMLLHDHVVVIVQRLIRPQIHSSDEGEIKAGWINFEVNLPSIDHDEFALSTNRIPFVFHPKILLFASFSPSRCCNLLFVHSRYV